MNAPASITVTPIRVADLLAEDERMPVYVHLIDHPDARVLVDTGMTQLHPAVADLDPRIRPLSEQNLDTHFGTRAIRRSRLRCTRWWHDPDRLSLLRAASKEDCNMVERARLTSKGQVTIPKRVRDALDLREGDEVVFRVEQQRAVVAKTPNFLELAGSVVVPAGKRGTAWDDVLRRTRGERAKRRR
jgi:AbrB family looped-hinge helix DNA binding protein